MLLSYRTAIYRKRRSDILGYWTANGFKVEFKFENLQNDVSSLQKSIALLLYFQMISNYTLDLFILVCVLNWCWMNVWAEIGNQVSLVYSIQSELLVLCTWKYSTSCMILFLYHGRAAFPILCIHYKYRMARRDFITIERRSPSSSTGTRNKSLLALDLKWALFWYF